MYNVTLGAVHVCHETGLEFVTARDGCTFNYCLDRDNNIYSDDGANLSQLRELSNRSKPLGCYLSSDGKHITTWKGFKLGSVTCESVSSTGWHGSKITHISVIDAHGMPWYGKGSGRGMHIVIRPAKVTA